MLGLQIAAIYNPPNLICSLMKSYRSHNSFLDLAKTSASPESQNPAGIEPGSVASRRLARAAALAQRVDAHLKNKLNTVFSVPC